MKSILFVDDEKAILNSIKREFFDTDYKLYFAESGAEALRILYENSDINMVISDFMMPQMNGYELLKKVKNLYPNIIRIILSGYTDNSSMIKSVSENIAQLYVNKPWDKEELMGIMDKLFDTSNKLNENDYKNIIENTENLPTIPSLFFQINKYIEDDKSNIDDLIHLINKDQTMAFKILKTINSAFYGIKTGSIKTAVLNLGLENLKIIVAAVEFFNINSTDFYMKLLWDHAYFTNIITTKLYEYIFKKKIPQQYSSAGLLHDIGKVIFLKLHNDQYVNILKCKDDFKDTDISALEKNLFNYTHEELGYYILNWWQLPSPIVETALKHSSPLSSSKVNREIVCIVHLANYYAWKLVHPNFMSAISDEIFTFLNIKEDECENIINHYRGDDYKL